MPFNKLIFHERERNRKACYKCGRKFVEGEEVYAHKSGARRPSKTNQVVGWLCEECYNGLYVDL